MHLRDGGPEMTNRTKWSIVGLVGGALLGIVVIAGGTHGWAAGEDDRWAGGSIDRAESHQSFLFIELYHVAGTHDEVAAVERWWAIRLYSIAVIVGGLVGVSIALALTRRASPQRSFP